MKNKLGVQIIGDVSHKLNQLDVEKELQVLKSFPDVVPYPEDIVGLQRSYPLWNKLGVKNNANVCGYEGTAKITEIGIKLTHISQMIKSTFNVNLLKLCRLNEFTSGTFTFPHLDYLDGYQNVNETYSKIHIPLKTQKECWSSYEEEVYHMKFGEIWLHDTHVVHSAANFSPETRFHLILEFAPTIPLEDLFIDKTVLTSSKKPESAPREPFTEDDLNHILNLAKVIDHCNFKDITALLGKIHFQKKVNCVLTYDWLEKIAEKTQDAKLIQKSKMAKYFYIGPRELLAKGESESNSIPQFQFFMM